MNIDIELIDFRNLEKYPELDEKKLDDFNLVIELKYLLKY